MNDAALGSKYVVLSGKMLQTVICSFSGLSFSRHGSMTPYPLSARPRCFAYHSCICCLFADLKKIPFPSLVMESASHAATTHTSPPHNRASRAFDARRFL